MSQETRNRMNEQNDILISGQEVKMAKICEWDDIKCPFCGNDEVE